MVHVKFLFKNNLSEITRKNRDCHIKPQCTLKLHQYQHMHGGLPRVIIRQGQRQEHDLLVHLLLDVYLPNGSTRRAEPPFNIYYVRSSNIQTPCSAKIYVDAQLRKLIRQLTSMPWLKNGNMPLSLHFFFLKQGKRFATLIIQSTPGDSNSFVS
jgi:hypothetical protein